MARKLKTYQTSLGFFDLAIAAPSMKAALEAWGADSNLFHQVRRRKAMIRTSSPRPWQSLASCSDAQSDPTDLSTSMPICPPILATANQRKPPASRKTQRRRRLALVPSTRLRSERPLLTTNGRKGVASLNERERRPPGRRSANAVSRRSTRRGLRSIGPNRSTRNGPRRSRPRSRLSRRGRRPKKPAGIKRRRDWRLRCGARGAS